MAGKSAILTLKILGDAKDAQRALEDTSSAAGKLQSGVGKAAVPAAAALAGLAAAGMSAAQAAAEDAASADQLALALRNGAGASDKSIANTEDWISKTSEAAAVADDKLRPALATLVRATGDVGESQDAMAVALDVSAATGKDVESVSTALAKAYGGQTAGLKKLVPGMDDAILATGDMDLIMAELARTTGGAAAEAANSTAGQMELMKIQMAEAQEAIGSALLPALSSLAKYLQTAAKWVQENSRVLLIVAGIVGGLASAILILNVAFKAYAVITKAVSAATKVWAAVQWLLNTAMFSSPITWIVIAIIALIAVIVLIATKTTWFQDIWEAVWGAITGAAEAAWNAILAAAEATMAWIVSVWESLKGAVKAVWDWIVNIVTDAWNMLVNIIKIYIAIYVAIWNGLVAAVRAVWNWIGDAIQTALGIIGGIVQTGIDTITRIWDGIKTTVTGIWDGIKDAAMTALDAILAPINAISDAFDNVIDAIRGVIDWLGKIKLPDAVAGIADAIGGLFSLPAPTPSTGTRAAVPTGRGFAAPMLSASAAGGSSGGATIVVQGALDPVSVARQIRTILKNDERRTNGVVIR